jgi:hypothetical protein
MALSRPLLAAALLSVLAVPASAQTRINQIQILGSHNSYRPVPTPEAMQAILAAGQGENGSLDYGHPPLIEQLDAGIRQLELDPVSDRLGGRFADPYDDDADAHRIMMQPGAKVLHIPGIDVATHCLTLRLCLDRIADWSRAHAGHELIVILVNTRDAPEPFTVEGLAAVDADILAAFGRGSVIAPDDVRGSHATLREAVRARAWPSVEAARGKILLIHDTTPRLTALYAQRHPSLAGRMMFGLHDETDDEAAVFNIQDPVAEGDRIRRLVGEGFLVRSRSDANTAEARRGDLARLDAAVDAGAQLISTDYYPGAPDPAGLGFVVRLADGFSQTNPRARAAAGAR